MFYYLPLVLLIFIYSEKINTEEIATDVLSENCKENETFFKCAPCEKTCAYVYMNPPPCNKMCKRGCRCNNGFVRNTEGICVLDSIGCRDEEFQCLVNEELIPCMNPHRELSCKKQFYFPHSGIYLPYCMKGCVCKEGFILDDINNKGCIPINECAETLDCLTIQVENTVFQTCGIAKRCKSYLEVESNYSSTEMTCRAGCFCKDGYIENMYHEQCIPEEDCTVKP